MSRLRTFNLTCTFDGCSERGFTEYANARELGEAIEKGKRWRCVRHRSNDGDDVLTADHPKLVAEEVVIEETYGRFWKGPDATSGFTYGPGFKAFAEDWPVGTRLRVTAEIITSEPHREP